MMTTIAKRIVLLVVCLASSALAQDSRLGTYHAQRLVTGGARSAQEQNALKITLSDNHGNILQTINRSLPYDVGPPAVGVFETGSCVLLGAFLGILDFYDPGGTLVRSVRLHKDNLPQMERVLPYAVHDVTLAVAVSEPDQAGVRVFRFTEAGDLLFETDVAGEFATGVVFSSSGDLCAVGTAQWNDGSLQQSTALVSADGTIVRSFPAGCSLGAFARKDSLLLLATTRSCEIFSTLTGASINRSDASDGEVLLDVSTDSSAFYILSARNPSLTQGGWVYSHPSLARIDSEGTHQEVLGGAELQFTTARLKSIEGHLMLQLDSTVRPVH